MAGKHHRFMPPALCAIALVTYDHAPPRVAEPLISADPVPRGAALLRQTMLDGQNAERARLGLPPLAWDETLAASARAYVEEIARAGRFAHADQPQGPERQGENLWTGTRDAYRFDEMLGRWLGERRVFVNAPAPRFSSTGRWQDASHYSQIVWRKTQRMGCAIASGRGNDYLACRYLPAGNIMGQTPY